MIIPGRDCSEVVIPAWKACSSICAIQYLMLWKVFSFVISYINRIPLAWRQYCNGRNRCRKVMEKCRFWLAVSQIWMFSLLPSKSNVRILGSMPVFQVSSYSRKCFIKRWIKDYRRFTLPMTQEEIAWDKSVCELFLEEFKFSTSMEKSTNFWDCGVIGCIFSHYSVMDTSLSHSKVSHEHQLEHPIGRHHLSNNPTNLLPFFLSCFS